MNRIISILSTLSIFSIFIFIATSATFEIADPDTMLYLTNGRYILSHGLPQGCIFSYTLTECPIAYSEWLLHLVVYLIYLVGSWKGLVLFQVVCVLATFGIMFFVNRQMRVTLLSTCVILFISSRIASERFMLRADMIGLIPLTIQFWLMSIFTGFKHNQKGYTQRLQLILPIALTQLIWANIHGSFIIGLLMIAAFLIPDFYTMISTFLKTNTLKNIQTIRASCLVILASLGASMINPYGLKAFYWPIANILGTTGKEMILGIGEYRPPLEPIDFSQDSIMWYKLMLPISLLLVIINIRRVRFAHVLLLLSGVYLSIHAIRYLAVFAVFAGMILTVYVDQTARFITRRLDNWSFVPLPTIVIMTILGFMIYDSLGLTYQMIDNSYYITNRSSRRFGFGISSIEYPSGAVDFIEKNHLPGNMFNAYKFGGYLHFRLYPAYKTFMHGSVLDLDILQTMELFRYYRQVSLGTIPHEEVVEKYGITFFLIDHNNSLSYELTGRLLADPHWKLVYLDPVSLIFLADRPETKTIIQKYAINVYSDKILDAISFIRTDRPADQASFHTSLGNFFSRYRNYTTAQFLYEEGIRTYPSNGSEYNNLGIVFEKTGKYNQAIDMYRQSIAIDPTLASSHLNLGRAYLKKKYARFAIAELQTALKINPKTPGAHYLLGEIFKNQKNYHRAKDYYRKELTLDPNHELARKALKQL